MSIDLREYGKMEAKVEALTQEVTQLNAKVDRLLEIVNQGQGGMKAMIFIGSVVGAVGGWISSTFWGNQ